VSHADQEVREAGRPGRLTRQGVLKPAGGRRGEGSKRPPIAPAAYRLKRSIEVFAAGDGTIYLMRPPTGGDFEIRDPSATQRAMIDRLARGWWAECELDQAPLTSGSVSEARDCIRVLEKHGLLEYRRDEELLTTAELDRFDRQLRYFADLAGPQESAPMLQRRLTEATVVVLGCGGLGSWAASALACAGVGELVLIDDDIVEASNLNRQLLFGEADIGQLKVERAAAALRRHSGQLRVSRVARRIRRAADLADVLPGVDLLIAAADWPPYQLLGWVNEACLAAAVPFITAAQFPPRVRVGPLVIGGQSPCWECIETNARATHPHYAELAAKAPTPSPAATLGAASGVAGSLLAMEAIHFLTRRVPPPTSESAVLIDLLTLELTRLAVTKDPSCRACASLRRA
jgi:bacteriocin biosynthesis cyclodehydratase domain-containing protein